MLYNLIPIRGLEEVHKVLNSKLDKHDINEWKHGLKWSEVISSLKKHLIAFEKGEDFTPEGNLSIAEVATNALILAEYYKINPAGDDRDFLPINKPIVALDIDDVCLDFIGSFAVMETRNFRFYRRRRKDLRAVIKYSEQIRNEIKKYIN